MSSETGLARSDENAAEHLTEDHELLSAALSISNRERNIGSPGVDHCGDIERPVPGDALKMNQVDSTETEK